MTKRSLIVASFIGLAAAIVSASILNRAAGLQTIDLLVLGLNIVAAGIAGRVILGQPRVHRYFALGTVLLSAIAAAILTTALTNYLINIDIAFGPVNYAPTTTILVTALIGFVVYLLAATVYVITGSRQRIGIGSRVGLLVLLLLAVVPLLNVLGLIGFTITAFVRGTAVTPAPPAASE
jgi:hypothetical protein